jgi:hypothetical protein
VDWVRSLYCCNSRALHDVNIFFITVHDKGFIRTKDIGGRAITIGAFYLSDCWGVTPYQFFTVSNEQGWHCGCPLSADSTQPQREGLGHWYHLPT